MDKVVLDASVVLEWLSSGKSAKAALRIHEAIIRGQIAAYAPDFLLLEVANILFWKKRLAKELILGFVERLLAMGISFDSNPANLIVQELVNQMVKLKLTAYDCQYLYLAQKLKGKLLTFDQELLKIKDWTREPD